ncbi:MAG: hypothetical protein Q8M31_03705 [Beijerinckiaceae bacterium]|nr:hypothetical protein [Beijerinckiaceae bacterium]
MALVIKLLGGLSLWAGGFSLLYALHGYGCAVNWGQRTFGPFTQLGLALLVSWLALLSITGLFVYVLHRQPMPTDPMLTRVALIGAWGGLIGMLLTGAPVVLPARCL